MFEGVGIGRVIFPSALLVAGAGAMMATAVTPTEVAPSAAPPPPFELKYDDSRRSGSCCPVGQIEYHEECIGGFRFQGSAQLWCCESSDGMRCWNEWRWVSVPIPDGICIGQPAPDPPYEGVIWSDMTHRWHPVEIQERDVDVWLIREALIGEAPYEASSPALPPAANPGGQDAGQGPPPKGLEFAMVVTCTNGQTRAIFAHRDGDDPDAPFDLVLDDYGCITWFTFDEGCTLLDDFAESDDQREEVVLIGEIPFRIAKGRITRAVRIVLPSSVTRDATTTECPCPCNMP